MSKRAKSGADLAASDPGPARLGGLSVLLSLGSLLYYFQRGDILMHGDATAHINIARRVFDSLTPGPLQLGTVWLPLPHLLMMPFLVSDSLWQSGVGGSIPSMGAYIAGTIGMFRLVRGILRDVASPARDEMGEVGAWLAALVYALNPNLLYMQATALTEPLYLAFFIWALVYFAEFLRTASTGEGVLGSKSAERANLWKCAACIACAEMSRYDGWFLALAIGAIVGVMAIRRWDDGTLRRTALKFLLVLAIAPAIWLVYNAAVYKNALEFANGPYSARGIEDRVGAPYPGHHNVWVASEYFLKSAQANLAVGNWGRFWLLGAVAATVFGLWRLRGPRARLMLVLLWSPLAFYALSIGYGSVMIHVPMWWPFAIFNQRFGLELLPLFTVSVGIIVGVDLGRGTAWKTWGVPIVALVLIAVSYAYVWKEGPLCWQEAFRSWETRRSIDTAVGRALIHLPPESRLLMDTGEHVGALERVGIPLRRFVNSENQRVWKRPEDPDGLWARALADPPRYVDYAVTFEGDVVDRRLNRKDLTLLTEIHVWGQPPARIYMARGHGDLSQ